MTNLAQTLEKYHSDLRRGGRDSHFNAATVHVHPLYEIVASFLTGHIKEPILQTRLVGAQTISEMRRLIFSDVLLENLSENTRSSLESQIMSGSNEAQLLASYTDSKTVGYTNQVAQLECDSLSKQKSARCQGWKNGFLVGAIIMGVAMGGGYYYVQNYLNQAPVSVHSTSK